MIKLPAQGFHWDRGNIGKCGRHGLKIEDIEDFFRGEIQVLADRAHSLSEERFIAVGRGPQGRAMFVGFTYRECEGALLIRPISARYMHKREAIRYGQAASQIKE